MEESQLGPLQSDALASRSILGFVSVRINRLLNIQNEYLLLNNKMNLKINALE